MYVGMISRPLSMLACLSYLAHPISNVMGDQSCLPKIQPAYTAQFLLVPILRESMNDRAEMDLDTFNPQ